MYYILDGHEVVLAATLEQWAEFFKGIDNRRVAFTSLWDDCTHVSTVFIGLDHRFSGDGPPLVFETMVFHKRDCSAEDMDDFHSDTCERYSTWDEAIDGHERIVSELRESGYKRVEEKDNHNG